MKQQFQMQKEEVKKMFLSSSDSILQKLNFIDSLQRLGVSYHFQHEIDEALEQIYNLFTNDDVIIEKSCLHCLALLFRLLRQRGYHISSGMQNFATISSLPRNLRFMNHIIYIDSSLKSHIAHMCG